jgi:hypothetical protein
LCENLNMAGCVGVVWLPEAACVFVLDLWIQC